MGRLYIILLTLFVFLPLAVLFGAAVTKFLWWLCNMSEWTGLGSLPWGPAVFLTLVLGGSGAATRKS